jgi:hypothetical protein
MTSPTPASDDERAWLAQLRSSLLRLHRALLEYEQLSYEKENGRVASPFLLLQLAAHDPSFAWLRPLSLIIVQFDEAMDGDEQFTSERARQLREQARSLLTPEENGEGFERYYYRALQDNPAIPMLHGRLTKMLA